MFRWALCRVMSDEPDDPMLILAIWPVLTVATIATTLAVALFAEATNWNQLTPSEYDTFLVMPALPAPALTFAWGRRRGGESDMARFAFGIGAVTVAMIVLRMLGEEVTFGLTVFGLLPYSGALVAVCLALLHAPIWFLED